MKGLIQRVKHARVTIDGEVVGKIDKGILLLLGVEKEDGQEQIDKLLHKVINYRIFPDQDGKMNIGLKDDGGELLIVSQFTLVADTRKGLRPGFSKGATPAEGEKLYQDFIQAAELALPNRIATGQFGADMKVELLNDGPVTFMLES